MLAHFFNREQTFGFDRLNNRALAHAVAAAHFIGVGHFACLALAFMTGVANVVLAEHQLLANFLDGLAFTHQLEIPGTVYCVAIQTSPNQFVFFDDQLFVHTTNGVGKQQFFAALAAHEVASGEQINSGYFQFGGGHRAFIAPNAELRQVVGTHLGLFKQGGHQSIGHTAMACTFAY